MVEIAKNYFLSYNVFTKTYEVRPLISWLTEV